MFLKLWCGVSFEEIYFHIVQFLDNERPAALVLFNVILFNIILSPRARVLTLGSCKSESDAGQVEPGSESYIFFYSFTEIIILCSPLL